MDRWIVKLKLRKTHVGPKKLELDSKDGWVKKQNVQERGLFCFVVIRSSHHHQQNPRIGNLRIKF